jgi:hypothetical protein
MIHLESFNQFDKYGDTLMIFDFDDTIVNSPSFEELAIEYLKENETIGSLLKKSTNQIGINPKDLKIENGRLYVNDPDEKINIKGNWVRKKTRVYLITPDKFYFSDISLPKSITKLAELSNKSKNKAIVTGRIEDMKLKVEESLDKLGLDRPNWGLFCFPNKDESGDKVPTWKGKTIVKLIKESGFKNVKFYDDKSKWVNKVVEIVKQELPEINFEGIKVKKES